MYRLMNFDINYYPDQDANILTNVSPTHLFHPSPHPPSLMATNGLFSVSKYSNLLNVLILECLFCCSFPL